MTLAPPEGAGSDKLTVKVKVVLPESPSATLGSSMDTNTVSSSKMVTIPVSEISIFVVFTVPAVVSLIEIFTV